MVSSGVDIEDVHLPGAKVELHGLEDGVRLLVLGHSRVQVRLLGVGPSHLVAVMDLPQGDDRVAEEEPAQSSSWAREDLAKVEDALGTATGHHVNE